MAGNWLAGNLLISKELIIYEAAPDELDPFINLLDEIGVWLWSKGIEQWSAGIHRRRRDELRERVAQGYLILAMENGRLAGGCILSNIPVSNWKGATDDAMYICSLAVARFAAGQDVGREILAFCTDILRREKRAYLRLDCWDGNDFLKGYYQRRGFEELTAVAEQDYFCRLFEKEINL